MRLVNTLWFLLASAVLAGHAHADFRQDETTKLNEFLDARYEQELQRSPQALTYLGRKEHYDQIDDYSEAGEDINVAALSESLEQMKMLFDYSKLTPQGKSSYDFWAYRVEQEVAAQTYRRSMYTFDQFSGRHTHFANFLINYHEVESVADMEAYIARIKASSRALRQLLKRAQLGASGGVRPPRFAYAYVIEESRGLVSGEPFEGEGDSPLWADVKQEIAGLRASGAIDEHQANRLQQQARQAMLENWGPAYQAIISWLQSDLANTDELARGVHSLPKGGEYYRYRVGLNTQGILGAAEIHALGLREVARIRKEMEGIKRAVGFDGNLEELFDFIRADSQFYFPNTDEGRRAYIDETRTYLAKMRDRLPEYFGILPKAPLLVKRVEAFQEQDGAAAYYQEGTADGSRPGVYYLHLSDMSANNKTDMETTAYHEGYPGHHLQGAIAAERTDMPLFRTQEWYSAYGEGWALYSELLAKEMGAFENPYSDFGRLLNEMWRAVRLVLDTGIHAKGWSEQQAFDYMMANIASPEATVRSEVQRYIVSPGQALSYKMGMLKILELRARAKQQLGSKFDIRGFHDVVLGGGAVPLPLLERAVDNWIVSQGR